MSAADTPVKQQETPQNSCNAWLSYWLYEAKKRFPVTSTSLIKTSMQRHPRLCKEANWKKIKYEMKIFRAKHWAAVSTWWLFSRKTSCFTSDGILGSEGGTCSWNSWLTNQRVYIHIQLSFWAAAGRRCTNGCKVTSWQFNHLRASVRNACLWCVSRPSRHRRAGTFILQSSCKISQLVQVLFYWRHICRHNLTAPPPPPTHTLLLLQYTPEVVHQPSPSLSSQADTCLSIIASIISSLSQRWAPCTAFSMAEQQEGRKVLLIWLQTFSFSRMYILFQHSQKICSHGTKVNVTLRPQWWCHNKFGKRKKNNYHDAGTPSQHDANTDNCGVKWRQLSTDLQCVHTFGMSLRVADVSFSGKGKKTANKRAAPQV